LREPARIRRLPVVRVRRSIGHANDSTRRKSVATELDDVPFAEKFVAHPLGSVPLGRGRVANALGMLLLDFPPFRT